MKLKKYVQKISENNYYAKLAYTVDDKPVFEKENIESHEKAMAVLNTELEKIESKNISNNVKSTKTNNQNNSVKKIKKYKPKHTNRPNLNKMNFFELSEKVIHNDNSKALDIFIDKVIELKAEIMFELIQKQKMNQKKVERELKKIFPDSVEDLIDDAQDGLLDNLEDLHLKMVQKRLQGMIKQVKNSHYEGSEEAKYLLKVINSIPGSKIVTVFDGEEAEVFDIKENGVVGYDKTHINLLYKQIDLAREKTGNIVIRQFIPDSEEDYITEEGKKIKMPWKAIYSAILKEDSFIAVQSEDLEYSFTHDIDDNELEPEQFVIYRDFDDLFINYSEN